MEKYRIPNLHNACRVLKLLSTTPQALSIRSISESLQIPRTTTLRILATLTLEGFTAKKDDCYSLGPSLVPIGDAAKASMDISELARPLLQQIVQATGETCHLAIPSGNRALIVEAIPSKHRLSSSTKPGAILDLHSSATGKCLLAFAHWPDLQAVLPLDELPQHTSKTLVTLEALNAEIESVRHANYAVDDEEFRKGARRIAAPVFSNDNQCVAAIGISGSCKRLPLERIEEIASLLKEAGLQLSRLLGWKEALEQGSA
ncbi:IclR family transcriptional regulator [Pelagicoccus sp. SDUM812005]|uniref:IclR family transcriptional regulator n=1 Tax=Pelagicoccus sp. SDUM812005 TaxID=3041257 RepID=UPI00280CF2CC|nr:IclR family transcriptional regulator [Pelagicoccus sp. SDUM812005]MDQ8179343.1 IclR family transcriptional regulator [Pelagicoccus sp. SDUM812005]